MDLSTLNFWAIISASIAAFLIGGIWYSPILFGNAWLKENHLTEEEISKSNPARVYTFAFILTLIMAFNLAAFLAGPPDLFWGMAAGALAGLGWVAASVGILYLFERKSMRLFLINAGYLTISFIVMGGIIGIWK